MNTDIIVFISANIHNCFECIGIQYVGDSVHEVVAENTVIHIMLKRKGFAIAYVSVIMSFMFISL